MSSNVRSYVVGWLIEDTKLRLVYGDRMGAAFSERVEFLGRGAHDFLLIVRAMGGASVHDLGILPSMHFPRHEEDGLVYESFVESKGYDGATLHLDIPIDQAPGSSGETHEQAAETLVFAVRSSGKVKTEFGGIGRGTTVFASSPQNERAKRVCEEDDLVAKVAWPHKVRAAEDATIRRIRHRLELAGMGRYLPHIVDLKCSSTRTIEEMHLPRLEMGLVLEEAEVRVCRTLILKRYERLEAIGSRERFHTVFVDVVRGACIPPLDASDDLLTCLQLTIGYTRPRRYCTAISASTTSCGI
ncbi:hypothetical protein DAEQUDRAFT_119003 [Daedalea quercina L-15889]|uniref:Fungal-type protein kinase domain-containing protein n=1 Tax=Daedalea quercina L-15889 TaxID=1314783 RepID=A0A165KS40_9APHY|nr:hypothetical protein DAEQUDRAFT_119003 [Daedalea quercina L-15889]